MSYNKRPAGRKAKFKARWQNKPFFLTKKYKDGLREMIWSRRRLSGNAQHVGLRILDRFASTPTIFANLEKLAGECDMSRPTLRKYMQELSKAGLFRFSTPPYWKRKSGFATEISFPTKAVEKWLRDNGFFMTMERNLPWSKAEKVNKTGVSPPAKLQKTPSTMERNFPSYQEVASAKSAAGPLAYGAAYASGPGAPPPRQGRASTEPMAKQQASGLGASYELANGKEKWFPATTERPSTIPIRFALDTRIGWDIDDSLGTVVGFGLNSTTLSKLLVQWDDEDSPGWNDYDGDFAVRPVTVAPIGGNFEGDELFADPIWFPATTVRPENLPSDFVIDAIVGVTIEGCESKDGHWDDGIEPRGKIVGYSESRETDGYVLVDWQRGANDAWWMRTKYLVVGGVAISDDDEVEVIQPADTPPIPAPVIQSPTLVPAQKDPDANAGKWTPGATVRHLKFGTGSACGPNPDGTVNVEFGEIHGVKAVLPAFLDLVEPASACVHPLDRDEPVFHIGDKTSHAGRGVGLITHIDGEMATVAFEGGELVTVPLSTPVPAA